MEPVRRYFEVREGATKTFVWYLKDWKTYHSILASGVESNIILGDVKLLFFLHPFEKVLKNTSKSSQHDTVIEGYSLYAQLSSHHKKVDLRINTKIKRIPELEDKYDIVQNVYITLEKSAKNQAGIQAIIEDFWKTAIWEVDYKDGDKRLEYHWKNYRCPEYDDLEITIEAKLCDVYKEPEPLPIEASKILLDRNLLPTQIKKFLQAKEEIPFSDVYLKMQDNVIIKAHRLILASGSPVFEAMFTSGMKECQVQTVEIPDIRSEVMRLVIRYVYLGELDPSWETFLEEVIYVGRKYQLDGLVDYCDKILVTLCTPGNVMSLLKLANQYNLQNALLELKSYAEIHAVEILMSQLQSS